MSRKLKIGVLGAANIAQKYIFDTIYELSEYFNFTGIASRDYTKASKLATKYKTKAYDSYSKLLDSSNFDAVYIPLPNSLHYVWVKKALLKGI